jgi:hypothetical protein
VHESSDELQNVCTRFEDLDHASLSGPQLVESLFGFPLEYSAVASKGPSSSEGSATRLRVLHRCGAVSGILAAVLDAAAAWWGLDDGDSFVVADAGRCRRSWNDAPAYDTGCARSCSEAAQVTLALVARSERGGSDLRLDHSLPFRAKAWPRATVDPHIWRWREILSTRWCGPSRHINVRELQASVVALRWRLRVVHNHRSRFVHLTDSQVCAAVLTKGRSSSRKLRAVLRRWNALCIAGDVYPVVGYIVSEDNPADRPSRRADAKPIRKAARRVLR